VIVQDTIGDSYLKGMRIVYHTAPDIDAAAEEILVDRADALVYGASVLRYLVNKDYQDDLRVLSLRFQPQEYAIALPRISKLRAD
jgi:ABC-type amino acid transport substrate-binding protein